VKLAILGGSFNPVHIGHLFLADAALSILGYDRVILVPAYQSPFKPSAEGASPRDRVEMLAASVASDPRITFDDCELKREGVSYTIDTVIDIIGRYRPEGKPGLIMGDDLASTFDNWRRPGEIAELADFIIARREGGEALCSFPYPYRALNNEIINVSSHQIREKIGKGDAWRYSVPSGARCIIEDRRLYGFSLSADRGKPTGESEKGGLAEIIMRLEHDVRSALNYERFVHCRNTALLSWDLCRRFGLESQKGYLAGIAHDMAKNLGNDELIRLAHADGASISKLEQRKPGLLHARAAAVLLQRKYGIRDEDVLEAIRYHTTGTRDMGPLAKIVYVADKIEISRPGVENALREMCVTDDLESLFRAVLGNTVSYLRARQVDISYGTRRLLAARQKRNNPGEKQKSTPADCFSCLSSYSCRRVFCSLCFPFARTQ
jgi:nicotinate-nucleotide adenylyltransferase